MAALDFPASPTIGQTYPVPPVEGVPVYTWDGEKWTAISGAAPPPPGATEIPLMDATPGVVGVSNNYAREDHVHPTDTSLTSTASSILNAIQINGGMEVNQLFGSGVVTPGWLNFTGYAVDGWISETVIATPGAAAFSVGTVDSTGAGPLGNLGIPWCLGITATGSTTFSGATDRAILFQSIEGTRFSRLSMGYPNAQPVTVSFWIWTTRPGTGCLLLGSYGTQYRYHMKEYTVTAANEWQYKTLTFPPETSPPENWPTGNTAAATLSFCFGGGSTSKAGVADTWANWTTQYATANQTNFFAANNDAVYVTGVTILPGTKGPTAAQSSLAMRSYATELAICQRYLQVPDGNSYAGYLDAGWGMMSATFTTAMRAVPTITMSNGGLVLINSVTDSGTATGMSVFDVFAGGSKLGFPSTAASFVTGQGCNVTLKKGSVTFDARL